MNNQQEQNTTKNKQNTTVPISNQPVGSTAVDTKTSKPNTEPVVVPTFPPVSTPQVLPETTNTTENKNESIPTPSVSPTNSTTQNIDQKTTDKPKPLTLLDNLKNFFAQFAVSLVIFIIIIFVGVYQLFASKVSQSNVLPTEMKCFPYSIYLPNIQPIDININLTNIDGEKYSQKLKFPQELNKSNPFLDFLRKQGDGVKSGPFMKYITSVFQSSSQQIYSIINIYFGLLNNIPETFQVFISPIISFFVYWILLIYSCIVFFWNYLYQMGWLFKKNVNSDEDENSGAKASWENISLFEPLKILVSIISLLLFLCIIFFFGITAFPVISSILLLYCFFTPAFNVGLKDGEKYFFTDLLLDFLKYKKHILMIIISAILVILLNNVFGVSVGITSLVVCLFVYFGIIPMTNFKANIPEGLTKLAEYKQAKKTCKTPPEVDIYNVLFTSMYNSVLRLFGYNKQKGGSSNEEKLLASIQKLHKKSKI